MAVAIRGELGIFPTQASRPEELTAVCEIINTGDEPVQISMAPLSSPSLCLEIIDSSGSPVLLPPPPVPRDSIDLQRLEPGERYTIEHPNFLPSWTPRGHFQARLRYRSSPVATIEKWDGELFSEWVTFELSPA